MKPTALSRLPTKPRRSLHRKGPSPLALEARLMFDGAAVEAVVHTAAAVPSADHSGGAEHAAIEAPVAVPVPVAPAVPQDNTHPTPVTVEPPRAIEAPAPRVLAEGNSEVEGGRHEIVFIDSSITNWASLAEQVKPTFEVVLLDARADGLAQISDYLQGRTDVDAIHIVAHGEAGTLDLGTTRLNAETLQAPDVATALHDIGRHLGAEGDILLYGCDIANSTDGAKFVTQLATLTSADLAASDDPTGSASLGGDWALEVRTGTVDTQALDLEGVNTPAFLLGVPAVTSVDDTTYNEGSGAIVVDSSITVANGTSYDGKYVRFSLTNGQSTDALALNSAANVNLAGAISISGVTVYVGTGSSRDAIGTVDAIENGLNGQALKINFVSTFTNSSFETTPLTGWTAINSVVNLGVTNIAGFVTPNDPTNPPNSGNDDAYPATAGTFTTTLDTSQKTDGNQSLRLLSSGMTTASGYDVVHGPAVYSDVFAAVTGDAIYFDWRAFAGGDAFDVFGYLLNTATGAKTTVLDATGTSTGASTAWATASASIPATGNYRFVFVSGTYDFSGGTVAGASMYLDNVRVFGSKVNDAVVTSIARQVTFQANSDAPATASTRVFTVTAASSSGGIGSDTGLINITTVNDAPTLTGTPQTLTYTENGVAAAIDTVIAVVDPDAPANFNGGYLQAQITSNGGAEDQLSVLNQGTAAGQIGVSGSNVTYGGVIIGVIDATLNGTNNAALRIALNSSASSAATQALARMIAYRNTSDAPSILTRGLIFTLNDGGNSGSGGALSGTRSASINVTAVDDPTVLTLSTGASSYAENNTNFFVDAGLTLTDVDSTTMNGAKVIIAGGFKVAEDQLMPASGTNGDGITYSYDATKGVLTLSGSATLAQYQAALRAVKYNNTSEMPDVAPRTITFTLGNAVALTINGVNHYYETVAGPVSWTAAQAAAGTRVFQGLTGYLATITSQTENDFIREKLTADAWMAASDDFNYINAAVGSNIYANQAASEGHWYWVSGPERGTRISDGNGSPVTASGSFAYWNTGEPNNVSSAEHFGEIFSTGASPGKWNDLPNSVNLSYVIEYSDSGGTPSFSKSLIVTPVRINDAPVTSGTVTMTGIAEDATANSGQLVSTLLSATDPDGDLVTGIAVTTLNSSRGTWQYSLDNGASWVTTGSVSDSSALLLRTTDRVRFIPDASNADAASITFKAWDRTNENASTIKAGVKVDVSVNGGITAYSTGSRVASITVTAVNDAPTLDGASPTLTGINEDAISNGGQLISSVLGATEHDVDTGALQGIAITSLNSGNGTWEYSINGGSNWIAVGAVAVNSALVLRDTDLIRFRPNGQNGGTASFNYKAWDRVTGTQGSKVDTTSSGGVTAFSVASNSASILIASLNDAPVLTGAALSLASISEDNASSAGQTVASFLGVTMSDVDNGAVQGIAITAQSVPGSGHWEYDNGGGWTTVGSVSPGAALLLRATDKLRFIPDLQHGGTATLTVRGWDTTTGTSGGTADTTSTGGTTAFSSVAATASLAVGEINDAPVFNTPADAAAYTELDSATPVGANLVLTDDGGGLQSASVRISSGFTAGDVLAVDTPGSLTVAYNAATGVLSLSGTASVATYQTALRSVTFASSSEDPTANAATRSLQWLATDTANVTSNASTTALTVVPTADLPLLGSIPVSWTYTEDDGTRVIAPSLALSDADDSFMSGATAVVSGAGYLTDGREVLGATTTGTGITASFNALTGTLTLSGTDSVANYQRVLRSVTYTNVADYNNPTNLVNNVTLDGTSNTRSVTWEVTDANSDGSSGAPTYGAQTGIAGTTLTIENANETPQVTNVTGDVVHILYVEGGAPATLEGLVSVIDDSTFGGTTDISGAFVRVTAGLEANDELGLYDAAALADVDWTRAGTATSGTLTRTSDGSTVLSYAWSAVDGDIHLQTTTGVATQADYSAVMQLIGYRSTSDDPTATSGSRSLIWRVTDSGGLQSAVTSAQTSIVDITAINDTAAVDSVSLPTDGDIVYDENGPVVLLAPTLTLADPDDTALVEATVVISGAGFTAANEYLSVPGATVTAGSNWTLTDVSGSGIDASYVSATGTLTLSGANTLAAYQTVLRQVTYGSSDENPTATAATRTISWTLTDPFGSRLTDADGGGNDGDSGSAGAIRPSNVTLTPYNDAPTLSGLGGTVSYTEGGSGSFLAAGLTLADVDDVNLSQAQVSISAGFTAGDTLGVAVPGSLGVAYNSATGVLTLSGVGSKAMYATALRSITFASSATDPTAVAPSRTLSWQISDANAAGDGILTSTIGATTLDISATDNAASISSLPANGAVTFTENGSAALAAPTLTLTDADDTQLAGATVAITAGTTAGDLLALTASLVGTGISIDGASTATSLVLTGVASLSDYRSVLRSITFSSTSDAPTAGGATRTLTWTTVSAFSSRTTDADAGNDSNVGATSVGVNSQVTITALNDAPAIAFDDGTPLDGTDAPIFEQGGSPLFVISAANPNVAGGITVTDVDDTQLGGASVRISDAFSTNDVLSIATPAGWTHIGNVYANGGDSITVTYNASNGTLTLSGVASKSGYQTLLGRVQYVNASSAPTDTGASRELTWTVTDANSAGDGARSVTATTYLVIRDRNDAPIIAPSSAAASYTEGALAIALPDIVVTDPDPGEIVTATLSLSSAAVGQLSVPTGASYDSTTGVWAITGLVSDVNAALAAVQFLPATNNDVNATISVVVTDGGEDAATAALGTISLNVTAVNDAPVLTPVNPVLNGIGEDDIATNGFQVGAFRGAVTDVDSGTSAGIVITSLTSGNGTWQYSVDGGGTWLAVGTVSDNNALLLRDSDRMRFVPNEQNGTSVDFTYRGWDGTGGSFGTKVDATGTGNAAPFSSAFDTASLTVATLNDAPVLVNGDTVLPSISEDETNDAGHLISDLLAGKVSDVDTGSVQGIAITGLTAGNGNWQYSLDDGVTWLTVGASSATNALLLRDTDKVRFLPDARNGTPATFDYRAWDRSSGVAGGIADVGASDATAAFSSEQNTVSLNVTDVNDAPLLLASMPAMTPLNEDGTANVGQTVANIVAGHISDVDAGAVQGIAIISTVDGNGRWQYTLDDGVTWTSIDALAVDTGVLLRDTDRLRFLPNSENATAGSFEFRAWDRSAGTAGSTVSIAAGNNTPFSDIVDTTTIVANGLNDAPVLAPDAPVVPTLDEDAQDNAGLQVAVMLGGTVTDVDVGALQGMAITGLNPGNGIWQYSLDGGTVWADIDAATEDSALLLRATDFVRFRPDASNATEASFNYKAWDQSMGTAGGRADTTPVGVTDPWSLATNIASISVTAVNDAPINDVLPSVSGGRRNDDTLRQDGVLIADSQIWHDVDLGDPAVSFRYEWEVADDALGTNLRTIDAATASQYSVTAAEIGKFVRVKVFGSDGQVETAAYSAFTQVTNNVPTANETLIAQQTSESVPIQFVIPESAFVDADAEDTLYYSASLADGSPLPSWLTFDPETRTFSGTPGGGDVGLLTFRVTVSDHGQQTASSEFSLRILSLPVNQPAVAVPTADTALPLSPNIDQSTPVDESYGVGSLSPVSPESLSTADLNDSFGSWVKFESAIAEVDGGGFTQPAGFQIIVNASQTDGLALLLAHPLIDQYDSSAERFHFIVPADTFSHTEREAVISLTATRLDGRPIPSWLRFNAHTGEFRGDPPDDFEGIIAIRVTARDNHGNEVSTIFRLHEQKVKGKVPLTGRTGLTSQLSAQLGERSLPRGALHRPAAQPRAAH